MEIQYFFDVFRGNSISFPAGYIVFPVRMYVLRKTAKALNDGEI